MLNLTIYSLEQTCQTQRMTGGKKNKFMGTEKKRKTIFYEDGLFQKV